MSTKIEWATNREAFAKRYAFGLSAYAEGNMAILSVMSDLQEHLDAHAGTHPSTEHYRIALNDIKSVLIHDQDAVSEALKAIKVALLDPKSKAWMQEHDPKMREQLQGAVDALEGQGYRIVNRGGR